MNLLNKQEIKQLTSIEIIDKIIETKKFLFNLKFKQTTKQSIKPHIFKQYKRMLAQLLTRESQLTTLQR